MSKKRVTSVYDLGRVLPSPVQNTTGYESSQELWARLKREEAEAEAAAKRAAYLATPTGKAEAEFNATLADGLKRVKKFWSLSLAEINEFQWSQLPVDPLGDYPTETERNVDADRLVFDEFYNALEAQSVTLSDDGWMRFFKFVACLARERNIKISKETLFAILRRCKYELQIFNNGEVTGEIPRPERPSLAANEAAERERNRRINDRQFEMLSGETRGGRAALLDIVGTNWSHDFVKWFEAWKQSLRDNFNFEFPDSLNRKVAEFLQERGLPHWKHASWDHVRISFVNLGLLPSHMLTEREKLDRLIEQSDISDINTRREINIRSRMLADDTPRPR